MMRTEISPKSSNGHRPYGISSYLWTKTLKRLAFLKIGWTGDEVEEKFRLENSCFVCGCKERTASGHSDSCSSLAPFMQQDLMGNTGSGECEGLEKH